MTTGNPIVETAVGFTAGGAKRSTLMELAAEIYATAVEKGFWDNGVNDDVVGKKLALVHSEVTEILEAIRKDQGELAVAEEFADVIIRLLDLYHALTLAGEVAANLDDVVHYKKEKNKARPQRHNNRF